MSCIDSDAKLIFKGQESLESWPLKSIPMRCPETSVNNYHTTPRNVPEERRSHEHRGGSLKSKECQIEFS
jgi:hypothetical protein